jgi:hypothetical protein
LLASTYTGLFATWRLLSPCSSEPRPSLACSVLSVWPVGALTTTAPVTVFLPDKAQLLPSSIYSPIFCPEVGDINTLSSGLLVVLQVAVTAAVRSSSGSSLQDVGSVTWQPMNVRPLANPLSAPSINGPATNNVPVQDIFRASEGTLNISDVSTVAVVASALVYFFANSVPLTCHAAPVARPLPPYLLSLRRPRRRLSPLILTSPLIPSHSRPNWHAQSIAMEPVVEP